MAAKLQTARDIIRSEREPRLASARQRAGLTLGEVATVIGVTRQALHKIERGSNTSLTTAFRLAHFYETTVDELFAQLRDRALEMPDEPA